MILQEIRVLDERISAEEIDFAGEAGDEGAVERKEEYRS